VPRRRAEIPYPTLPRLQLAGLQPDWVYKVEGRKPMSGQGLMNVGLALRLVGDYDSLVLRIKRIE